MKYQQPTFTLPTVNKSMTQTDYEIAVGLRNPDGSLVQPKVLTANITHYRDYTLSELVDDTDGCDCGCEGCGFDCGCLCS